MIIVPGNHENINLLDNIGRYMALRSPKTPHKRFFVNYVKEKCTVQPIGVHKIAGVPSVVAKLLKLENAVRVTVFVGHQLVFSPMLGQPWSEFTKLLH